MSRTLAITCTVLLFGTPLAAQSFDHNVLACPAPRGFAQTDDLVGLVISSAETMELIWFNTSTEKELKRVTVEFKPGAMCRQGKVLYVAGEGTGLVYAVDLATGKVGREYEVGGDAVVGLACHPRTGLIYASTAGRAVFSIDPASAKATKTIAVGKHIGVTADGASVVTGFQPGDGEFDYKVGESKRITIPWSETWGTRAQIVKYKVKQAELEFEAAQTNAASNGWSFHLSPDGKRVAMPGGGGWRPIEGAGGGYVTAVFAASNLQTMLGQAPAAISIAFHPLLDLGATGHDDGVRFFRAKSLKPAGEFKMKGNGSSALLAAAAKGTKLVYWNGTAEGQGLHFLPLELSTQEKSLLAKSYGELPKVVEVAPLAEPAKVGLPKVASNDSRSRPTTPVRPTTIPPTSPAPGEVAPKVPVGKNIKPATTTGKIVEFTAGFNDDKGLGADKKRFSPYPVGARGVTGGDTEPGWDGPWKLKGEAKFTAFVDDAVQEGDGALYFAGGTGGVVRKFSTEIGVPFEIEQYVRILEGGHIMSYVGKEEHATGAMWFLNDGAFVALNGTGKQFGGDNAISTGVKPDPEKWYKILLKIFPKQHEYEFYIDDQKYGERYHFRSDVDVISEVRYACEKAPGFLLDAITVRLLNE